MQRSRRRDPIPWTWEVPAGVVLAIVLVLTLGVQAGRSLANLLAGAGWAWVPSANLFTSLPDIARGDAGSGLTGMHDVAGKHLLSACVIGVELALIVAACWGAKVGLDRWGPNRLRGMATREEAEKLLGRSRLRKVAPVVRPDIYGKAKTR
ncbi:hypothetical protein ATK17_3765 [Branchiibius hedensis]|uniref:Conjugal transfer protein n=1 Tax=Branchiibius hedensis TaxID=672460 RepID=A0A2Y9BNS8_9MICO|nr:hypothetical protein [Branchiibius hedensis]PWJ23272.1 hypothetical protein ATK17_3765 [Branchiibius hedensis]SSA58961.1 hypothetical protein SAMN04489750_3765 [Branchiibius hedensis]